MKSRIDISNTELEVPYIDSDGNLCIRVVMKLGMNPFNHLLVLIESISYHDISGNTENKLIFKGEGFAIK